MQVLYEIDLTGHLPGTTLEERFEDEDMEDTLMEFSRQIVHGIFPLIQQLDDIISMHAPEWPLDQVAIIDRNIIRIALWEFAIAECTPVKVAINEAVELAKTYGADSTPRFVNGVLGSLALHINDIQNTLNKGDKQSTL